MTDPFIALAKKKKKSSLPKPEQVSTHFTAYAPSQSTLPKSHRAQVQRVQTQKVQAPKVKPVRYQAKAKQQQRKQAQAPAYRNEDFQFVTNVDNIGVNILVMFQGTLIYKFLLPVFDYELWHRMGSSWALRYEYLKMKVNPNAFMSDEQLVHSVIKTIANILNTLFAEVQRRVTREAQQQAQTNNKNRLNDNRERKHSTEDSRTPGG